jgi:hypothetical protein
MAVRQEGLDAGGQQDVDRTGGWISPAHTSGIDCFGRTPALDSATRYGPSDASPALRLPNVLAPSAIGQNRRSSGAGCRSQAVPVFILHLRLPPVWTSVAPDRLFEEASQDLQLKQGIPLFL